MTVVLRPVARKIVAAAASAKTRPIAEPDIAKRPPVRRTSAASGNRRKRSAAFRRLNGTFGIAIGKIRATSAKNTSCTLHRSSSG